MDMRRRGEALTMKSILVLTLTARHPLKGLASFYPRLLFSLCLEAVAAFLTFPRSGKVYWAILSAHPSHLLVLSSRPLNAKKTHIGPHRRALARCQVAHKVVME